MRLENLILSKKWPKGPSPGAHVRDRTIFHVDLVRGFFVQDGNGGI